MLSLRKECRPATKVEKLQEELLQHRAKEKKLLDAIKELKERLAELSVVETNLKRERLEVDKLRKHVIVRDSQFETLRRNCLKVKAELKNEEEHRGNERKELHESILALEKSLSEIKKKYASEKMLREQRDRELDQQGKKVQENKTLAIQNQTLNSELEHWKGKHNHVTKTIDELRQKLKAKQDEHRVLLHLHTTVKRVGERAESDNELLRENVNVLERFQEDAIQKDIQLQGDMHKQTEAHRNEIFKLTQMNKRLEEENLHQKITLEDQESKLTELMNERCSLTTEVENKRKMEIIQEAMILKLKNEVSSFSEMKLKLQMREEEISRLICDNYKENMAMKNTVNVLEKREKHGIVQIGFIKAEKDVIVQNLFKAQEEIDVKTKTIEKLTDTIQDLSDEISRKNSELDKVIKNYQSRTKQCRDVKRQLEDIKRTIVVAAAAAHQHERLLRNEMATMAAERDEKARELEFCNQQLKLKTQTIDNQNSERTRQQEAARDYMDEIKSLKLEIMDIKHQYDIDVKIGTQRDNHGNLKRPPQRNVIASLCSTQRQEHVLILTKLEEEKEKNEELTKMLAERPVDTTQKLRQCQRDIREVKEHFKVSQQNCEVYEEMCRREKERNRRLTDELRRLKLESAERLRDTRMPRSSNQTSSDPKDKPKSPRETRSRRTRFPTIPNTSQSLTAAESQPPSSPGFQARKILLQKRRLNLP